MKQFGFVLLLGLLLLPGYAAEAPAKAPDQLTREVSDQILSLLRANRDAYAKDHKKLYAMVDEVVLPQFDFRAMSRSVLARHWREATEDQRARFTKEFRDLLVRTYATALLKYTNEEIVFLPFSVKAGDQTAVVRTEVKQASGAPPVAIHYGFFHTDGAWKVYDLTIEGVSLVTNYRSTYAAKIKNEGLDALIAGMAGATKDPAPIKPATARKADGAK